MIFTDNAAPTNWTTGTITIATTTGTGYYTVYPANKENKMAVTRFQFPEVFIPTVTETTMLIGGKSVRDFKPEELEVLVVAIEMVAKPYEERWGKPYKIGEKTGTEIVKLIETELKRREDEKLDAEIEEAKRLVAAYETGDMKLKRAQAALAAAEAKKAARSA